jgi:BirA family biotin operon repressor/biotin-[acetyl-CoA-carboxylase] ligase
LSEAGLPASVRSIAFDEIDSTNAEAARLSERGEAGPLWIWSRAQSSGRGRLGRSWASPSGNLYATFLFTCGAPLGVLAQLSFVAALAAHDAARVYAGSRPLTIKWPNDLLLDGAKCCGILVESLPQGRTCIGWGVNLASHPTGTPYPVSHLGKVTPEAFLGHLAEAVEERLAQWDRGAGFARIRSDWLQRAAGLGQRIKAGELEGIFRGLAADGALMLETADGQLRLIQAGDVMLPSPTGRSPA